jgi:hypothetical protein
MIDKSADPAGRLHPIHARMGTGHRACALRAAWPEYRNRCFRGEIKKELVILCRFASELPADFVSNAIHDQDPKNKAVFIHKRHRRPGNFDPPAAGTDFAPLEAAIAG